MKLSAAQLAVLVAVDAGEPHPKGRTVTLVSLWRAGLIEELGYPYDREPSDPISGWRLTAHGKLAVKTGRLMLSKRRPE